MLHTQDSEREFHRLLEYQLPYVILDVTQFFVYREHYSFPSVVSMSVDSIIINYSSLWADQVTVMSMAGQAEWSAGLTCIWWLVLEIKAFCSNRLN